MTGPTAQLIALACHFNGRSRGLRCDALFPSNSTCQFCEHIHFVRRRRAWFGVRTGWEVAQQTPEEWLGGEARPGRRAVISHQRTEGFWLSDRMSAGLVGGGGRWRLLITDARRMDVWEASWEVGNRQAPDQRIWRVRYGLVKEEVKLGLPALRSQAVVIAELRQTLSDVLAFCEQHRLDGFGGCFRTAVECLSADDPFALVYHKDLAPENLLSLWARQVLAACQAAWVFGGMGSWNDMAFKGEEQGRYEKLSDALFTLLNEAIPVAANSAADFGNSGSESPPN